jgi:hypothetical protein
MTLIFYYQPDKFINNDTLRIDVSADAVFSFPASLSFHGCSLQLKPVLMRTVSPPTVRKPVNVPGKYVVKTVRISKLPKGCQRKHILADLNQFSCGVLLYY